MLNPAINRRATTRVTAATTALAAVLVTLSLAAVSAYPQAAVTPNPPAVAAEPQLDPGVTEYVNRVSQNIIRNSDAKVPFTVKVIQSDELNTVSLPGGFFYVNTGLILEAQDDPRALHEVGEAAKALAEQEAQRRELEKQIESRYIQDQLKREQEAADRAEVLLRRKLETIVSQESAMQRERAAENIKREIEALQATLERTLVPEADIRRMQEEVRRAQEAELEIKRGADAAGPALLDLRKSQDDLRRSQSELRQMMEEMRSMIEDVRRSLKDAQGKQ